MTISVLSQSTTYWDTFQIQETDLEFIYNHLLELETPQTPQELLKALVTERIRQDKEALEHQQRAGGEIYIPKNKYQIGQNLLFPTLNWQKGQVSNIRPGYNPEIPPFEVLEVNMDQGGNKYFASGIENHILNKPVTVELDTNNLDINHVLKTNGSQLLKKLIASLEANPDIVRIAGRWFPRSLLVDVNIGHLNLAEALLDMEGGGPLTTGEILEQVELPTGVNTKLAEFSLNLALQEDGRFDEVGPTGEVIWFLRKLEPAGVQSIPPYLKYHQPSAELTSAKFNYPPLGSQVIDELEPPSSVTDSIEEAKIALIFPHWRSGTLPLVGPLENLFPSAYESPRVQFTFRDGNSDEKFSGWVVRSSKYVYGLRDWYLSQGLIPGSYIHIKQSNTPGEVIIRTEKRRPNREWIRTALVGSDGNLVFSMLRQVITAPFDERMSIAIPDPNALDRIWEQNYRTHTPLEQTITSMMYELAKLNPQGHVHVEELYAAVNLVFRCPPGNILNILYSRSWAHHLGDLYFRLERSPQKDKVQ